MRKTLAAERLNQRGIRSRRSGGGRGGGGDRGYLGAGSHFTDVITYGQADSTDRTGQQLYGQDTDRTKAKTRTGQTLALLGYPLYIALGK